MRRSTVLIAVPLVLAAFAGPALAAEVAIEIRGFEFLPTRAVLAVGDTANWTNKDSASHSVRSLSSPPAFTSGVFGENQWATHTFAAGGTYPYKCGVHGWMRSGVIVVGPNTAPTVSTTLAAGTVSGMVTISGTAPDAEGPHTWVTVAIGGFRISPSTSELGLQTGPGYAWSVSWDTTQWTNGPHAVNIFATDGDLTTPILSVTVTVNNPHFVDLQVVNIFAQGATQKTLQAQVKNAGNFPSGGFSVDFSTTYKGQTIYIGRGTTSVGPAPGSSVTVTVPWDATGKLGTWPITAVADATNVVAESNEGNNAKTVGIVLFLAGTPLDVFDP